jgi:hypothetical protein
MAGLGDVEKAVELISGILPKITPGFARWLYFDNSLDPIRDDSRFKAMIAEAERLHGPLT